MIWRAVIAAAVALTIAAPAARAEPQALDEMQLDALRGGLRTPDGLEFGFGAVVRTIVDGGLALESQLTWTDKGAVETVTGGALGGLEGASLPGGASVDWKGVVLPGDGGQTTVLHNLDGGALQNVILNTASNRDLRQETAITLNVPALDQLQRDAIAARVAASLDAAVGAALRDAAVR